MMPIKKFIFWKQSSPFLKEKTHEGMMNPFVSGAAGRQEWNDRYENLAKKIWDWKRACLGALAVSFVLAVGLIHVASQSKIQPFAVEVNNGIPIAIKSMEAMQGSQQKVLVQYALTQFITHARTILNDPVGEKKILDKVYAYSADQTLLFLRHYYEKHNPFEGASQYTVSVKVINALELSHNTYQLTWDETKRGVNDGGIVEVTRWEANITYKFGEINQNFINDNPWGLYVTQLSWSQVQTV
jgi:type IV secretion system protein TrbF